MELKYQEYLKMRKIYLIILTAGILIASATPVKAQISFNLGVGIKQSTGLGPCRL